MVVKKLKELKEKISKKGEEEGFVEVETGFEEENKINVKIDSLKSYADVERILQFLREGNIIFLRIKDLRTKDINELKKAVEKLKKTCAAMDGDLVGVEEDFLVITPKFARVYRGKVA
ncbi:MAG: cell division protein SepF [Candidatus Aenigmatarchaeota archaeon]